MENKIIQLVPVENILVVYACPEVECGYIVDKCDFAALYEDGTTGFLAMCEEGYLEEVDRPRSFIGICRNNELCNFILNYRGGIDCYNEKSM